MRWYKTLARTLLMLSVINFALTAPVVVREHEVRVSVVDAAKDGTATLPLRRDPSDNWQVNMADRTNAPPILRSPDSNHWREQEPTQHNPRLPIGSNGLPEPSKPAPSINLNADSTEDQSPSPLLSPTPRSPTGQAATDEPDPSNPGSSSSHRNTDLNPSLYQSLEPTDDSHALNLAPPPGSRPKLLSLMDLNSSPEDQTNQSPRLSLGPTPTTPSLTSQAPADERDPLNPGSSSSSHRNTDLNPSLYLGLGPTDNSHALDTASPSGSRPKPVSFIDLTDSSNDQIDQSPSPPPGPAPTSPSPTSQAPADEPHPLNPHALNTASPSGSRPKPVSFIDLTDSPDDQIDQSPSPSSGPAPTSPSPTSQAPADEPDTLNSGPSSPHDDSHTNPASPLRSPDPASDDDVDLNFRPQSSSQKFRTLSELMSTTTRLTPPQDDSPQISSSSDESPSSGSWAPTESGSTRTGPPQRHVSPASLPDQPSKEESYLSSPDQSSTEESYLNELDQPSPTGESHPLTLATEEYYLNDLDQPSTGESHPQTLEPTDNPPLPASASNPGPSTEPNPPPSAKRPRPEEDELGNSLTKILKGKFKRRFSGSGVSNTAQGDLQGTDSRPYVTAYSLPFPSQQTTVGTNILTF